MSENAKRFNTKASIVRSHWERDSLAHCEDYYRGREIIAARANAQGISVHEYLADRENRRRARARAETVGLAYWPAAFKGAHKVDLKAYVIAEKVMARRDSAPLWGARLEDGALARGGWDMMGHYGLSPAQVAKMWYAAGCRGSRKYEYQVVSGMIARKGDSFPFFKNYVRGRRWLDKVKSGLSVSRKAVAALGRLSAPLRVAALKGVQPTHRLGEDGAYRLIPTRIRDLNWSAVAKAQKAIAAGGEGAKKVKAALSGVRRAGEILGVESTAADVAKALVPTYSLHLEAARRMALGESPVQLSGGLLDRKEAHKWCQSGAPHDVVAWLCTDLGVPHVRSARVARWLREVQRGGRWSAMTRERRIRVPGGDERTFTALSILDEIQEEDVLRLGDSVDSVLERSAERLSDAWVEKAMRDHRLLAPRPAWASQLPRQMRLLCTPAMLAEEGKSLRHCVGGYVDAVARGECYIVAISTRQGRSTVELSPTLWVSQHRGVVNSQPPLRNNRLLSAWLARVKKG